MADVPPYDFDVMLSTRVRFALQGNLTYYVRKDGNDSNNGLTNDAAGAFLTVAAAYNAVTKIDANGFTVTIQLGTGTWTERHLVPRMVGQAATSNLVINGNGAANTTLTWTVNNTPLFEVIYGALCTISNLKMTHSGAGTCFLLNAAEAGVINVGAGMEFGAVTGYQWYSNNAGTINGFQPYMISGGGTAHWVCGIGGTLYCTTTVTISTAVTYTFAFAAAITNGSMQINGNTFVNPENVTAPAYAGQKNGTIETFSANKTCTGVAVGTVDITITAPSGTIVLGRTITGTGIAAGTRLVTQSSGPVGGAGTYQMNTAQTFGSTTVTIQYLPCSAPGSLVTGGQYG